MWKMQTLERFWAEQEKTQAHFSAAFFIPWGDIFSLRSERKYFPPLRVDVCVSGLMRVGGGWKKRRTLEREKVFYFGSRIFFARKNVACFRWPGGWLGGLCRRKIYDMYASRVHKTTHISLSLKEEIHDCIGRCFCGWVKKMYRCLYSGAHSFDTWFSHAGLASLFITNFRVKNYVYIL